MNKPDTEFDAIILAGGLSSRMGRDKSQLKTPDGLSLIEKCNVLLRQAGAREVLLSSNTAANGIKDNYPLAGPLAGIEAALPKVTARFVIIVPVDMPLLSESMLKDLVRFGIAKEQSCCFENYCLPLLVCNPKLAYKQVQSLLYSNEKASVWRFCRAINCSEIPTSESARFENANTPEQWRDCLNKMKQ